MSGKLRAMFRMVRDAMSTSAQLQDIMALQKLAPLSDRYRPWSTSAMRPCAVTTILNEVIINNHRCVVECGGGVSTLYLGQILKANGGHLFTIEHDCKWADYLQTELVRDGLDDCVTVIRAPLRDGVPALPGYMWYDTKIISAALAGQRMSAVIIDGPPAYAADIRHSRYPALPFFRQMLSDKWVFILDDAERAGEREILRRWKDEFGVIFAVHPASGGIAIARSMPSFNI